MLKIFKMILIIIGVDSRIAQMLTTFIADILDKITGENTSPTPTSNAHDIIHLLITEFETKPHFRNYVYIITIWVLSIISLHFQQILDFFLQIANHH